MKYRSVATSLYQQKYKLLEIIINIIFSLKKKMLVSFDGWNQNHAISMFCDVHQIMVKKLQKEIGSLKRELAMHDTLTNRSQITYDPLSEQQRYEIKQQVRQFIDGNLDEVDVSAHIAVVEDGVDRWVD